jgi:hypothetical protein
MVFSSVEELSADLRMLTKLNIYKVASSGASCT